MSSPSSPRVNWFSSVASTCSVRAPVSFEIRSSAESTRIADEHVVVARVHQEAGNHAADLAGAEKEDAMHGGGCRMRDAGGRDRMTNDANKQCSI